jgi:hypothetical protein
MKQRQLSGLDFLIVILNEGSFVQRNKNTLAVNEIGLGTSPFTQRHWLDKEIQRNQLTAHDTREIVEDVVGDAAQNIFHSQQFGREL